MYKNMENKIENNFVITIGRQIGGGGLLVGKQLAEKLKINFYDKELLKVAAKESGICEEYFEGSDEKKKFDFLGRYFSLRSPVESDVWNSNSVLSGEKLFEIQSTIIKEIAERESAVIVGRTAEYILRDYKNCTKIFVMADFNDRIKRISELKNISEKEAQIYIEKNEKKRADYYEYYTGKQWGDAKLFDLCINTSKIGMENTVEMIIQYISTNKK